MATRTATALALVVLAGVGVRSTVVREPLPAPTTQATVTVIDSGAAVSTAEYAARAWLTLDVPADREQRLARVWADPHGAGWDGNGSASNQGQAYTVAICRTDETHVTVTVAVYVVQSDGVSAGWVGVLVPISLVGGAASVDGDLKLVGLPAPAPVTPSREAPNDSRTAAETREVVANFFTAWAEGKGNTLAPGASIDPLPESFISASLVAWKVDEGSGTTRVGTATVALTMADATVTTTYRVTLTQVSSGANTAWQVSAIN